MALQNKKYTRFYATSGTDADKVADDKLLKVKGLWEADVASGANLDLLDDPIIGPLVYQLQQMQDEIDYLRTEISSNKDKTGITTSQANAITANTAKTTFPGLGTSSTTALAGDTTTISTAQANEITASTTLGTKLNVTQFPAN